MSENAEFEVVFPKQDPNHAADAFSQARYASAPHRGEYRPTTSEPKPNLVVRAWRAVAGWIGRIGRAVFSKKFLREYIVAALRDAFAAIGYSLGMRMVKNALGTGDVYFQDKQGVVTANTKPNDGGGQAFQSQGSSRDWPPTRSTRSYGSAQDDIMAYSAQSRPYQQQKFNN